MKEEPFAANPLHGCLFYLIAAVLFTYGTYSAAANLVMLCISGIEANGAIVKYVHKRSSPMVENQFYLIESDNKFYSVDLGTATRRIGESVRFIYEPGNHKNTVELQKQDSLFSYFRQKNYDVLFLILVLVNIGLFLFSWRYYKLLVIKR